MELDGLDIDELPPVQQWEFLQRMGRKVVKNWEWGKVLSLFWAYSSLTFRVAWNTTVDDALHEALRRLEQSA